MTSVSQSSQSKVSVYRKIAIALGAVGMLTLIAVVLAYAVLIDSGLSQDSTDWGTFGDFVGGIAGTVIALSTLVALVIALQLQAKELEQMRSALDEQTKATQKQIERARLYEERRVQPLLKAEWSIDSNTQCIYWRITNVGLGPCIMDSIELFVFGQMIGSHEFDSRQKAHEVWCRALSKTLDSGYPGDERVFVEPLQEFKRALKDGEYQQTVRVNCTDRVNVYTAADILDRSLRPVIRFRSLAGVPLSTEHQYDRIVRESGVGDML